MVNGKTASVALLALTTSLSVLTGCGSGGTQPATVRSGAVPLEQVRIGTPDSVFKEAVVSFVVDPHGTADGKTQYISRFKDADGGQYLAQVKNNDCYEVDIVNADQPLSKEAAIQKMEHLIPPDVMANAKAQVKSPPDRPVDLYSFNPNFGGRLQYTDNTKTKVSLITAFRHGTTL